MSIKLVDEGLLIESPGLTIIINDEEFDPTFWIMLIMLTREGVIYG